MSQRTAGNPPKKPRDGSHLAAAAGAASSTASSSSSSSSASSPAPFPTALAVKVVVACVGWYLSCRVEFGSIFLICLAIYLIFTNLSSDSSAPTKAGHGISAYSVFNRGATRIAGSMDAESFENEIRHAPRAKKEIDLDIGDTRKAEHPERKSKAANQPCVCGSGKKYKNCCSPLTLNQKQEDAEWEAYEKEWGGKR
jgi:hypothetical protein